VTDRDVGALLGPFSLEQQRANLLRIISHVSHSNDRGDFAFNREEDPKIAPADDRTPEEPMLLRKHLWIPLNPRNGLVELLAKPRATICQPRIVIIVSVAKIVLDERQELYRLALHLRATRRSNSPNEIRCTLPAR